MSATISDHSLAEVSMFPKLPGAVKPFRFNSFQIEEVEFLPAVQYTWKVQYKVILCIKFGVD